MTPIWAVLTRPSAFEPAHVEMLRRQLARVTPAAELACFTDQPEIVPATAIAERRWPGAWSKMELIGISFDEDLLLVDPDVVLLGDISPIFDERGTVFLSDFADPEDGYCTSLMRIDRDDRLRIWREWARRPERWMEANRSQGDRRFFEAVLGLDVDRWQQRLPGQIISYRYGVAAEGLSSPPAEARMCCFHGTPRPWQVKDLWVRQALR